MFLPSPLYFVSSLKCKLSSTVLRLPILGWLHLFSKPPCVLYVNVATLSCLSPRWTTHLPAHIHLYGNGSLHRAEHVTRNNGTACSKLVAVMYIHGFRGAYTLQKKKKKTLKKQYETLQRKKKVCFMLIFF